MVVLFHLGSEKADGSGGKKVVKSKHFKLRESDLLNYSKYLNRATAVSQQGQNDIAKVFTPLHFVTFLFLLLP